AMENPVSRFWFLRASGFPNIDPQHFSPQEIRTNIPMLEIYHPDRSLESAMRRRMISSLLLSIGTLILLLSAYFVLYVLLARTEGLRNRERDFVTSMSHELRTPLSVISATSDNLVRGIVDDPGKVKKYGTIIQAQSHRLGKMVESILLYSGIQSRNDVSIRSEEIHLESFFGEIVQNLLPAAEDKGAGILFSKDTQIATVQSDPEALRIISENLIVNALRHGIADTGAKSAQVRVQLRTRPPRLLYIIVEDDGPGIAQQEMKRIFEPFVRGERSKAQQIPGSGLGLHIVRKVVDQLGGQVGVESPYQDMAGISKPGVRFTVRIPVRMA
ncbi:MAG: HAMP domain-containing histidine kinase, partial [Spirochaetales bacterium]|nr:HAMP domain-containing histidine kinase [Spirochaetales bacterium]